MPKGTARSRTSKAKIKEALANKDLPDFHSLKEALRGYVYHEGKKDQPNIKGLHLWIRDGRYDAFLDSSSGDRPAVQVKQSSWRSASMPSSVEKWFNDMSAVGVPDQVLNDFVGNVGITHCNVDRGGLPAVVVRHQSLNSKHWYPLMAEACMATGYSGHPYTKAYVEHVQWKKKNKVGCFADTVEGSDQVHDDEGQRGQSSHQDV